MTLYLIVSIILLSFLVYILVPRENGKLWDLSEDSWLAKYYTWVVGELPNGGCVYFWVSIGLILISPIAGIVYLLRNKSKDKPKDPVKLAKQKKAKEVIECAAGYFGKLFIIVIIILGIVGVVGILLSSTVAGWIAFAQALGILALGVIAVVIICWLWTILRIGKGFVWAFGPFFGYLGSMIKAIYTKSCPKITWRKKS